MTAVDAALRLARLAAHLRARTLPAEQDADAVASALEAYVDGDAGTLDDALGVQRGRGGADWRQALAIARRDDFLREAFRRSPGCSAASLAAALARYCAGAWLRERGLADCPAMRLDTVEECFWRALTAHPVPLGRRALHDIGTAMAVWNANDLSDGRVNTGPETDPKWPNAPESRKRSSLGSSRPALAARRTR